MNSITNFKNEYAFLSNFYPLGGVGELTAEHLYQAAKTNSPYEKEEVLNAESAGAAKRLGRKVTLRPDWELVKVSVMESILMYKFLSSSDLLTKLHRTGDTELREGNYWHDNFWGDCVCPNCRNIEGKNMLGVLLMKVRRETLRKANA